MLLPAALFVLFMTGCWLYCLADAALTPAADVRGLPKPMWLCVITVTFIVGAVAWLVASRKNHGDGENQGNWAGPRQRAARTGKASRITTTARAERARLRLRRRPADEAWWDPWPGTGHLGQELGGAQRPARARFLGRTGLLGRTVLLGSTGLLRHASFLGRTGLLGHAGRRTGRFGRRHWNAADEALARHPAGRSRAEGPCVAVKGPDDDPDFLHALDLMIRGDNADDR